MMYQTMDIMSKFNTATNGASAGGYMQVSNFAKYINVSDCDYYVQPALWCEAESQVVYSWSGSVGVSLAGTFSFSISAGASWTGYVVLRASLVQEHIYHGYYY